MGWKSIPYQDAGPKMKAGDSGQESVSAGLGIVLPPMIRKIVVTFEQKRLG